MILNKFLPNCSCRGTDIHTKNQSKFVKFRIGKPFWLNACSVECLIYLEEVQHIPFLTIWDAKSRWWNYRCSLANLCHYLTAKYIQPKDGVQ